MVVFQLELFLRLVSDRKMLQWYLRQWLLGLKQIIRIQKVVVFGWCGIQWFQWWFIVNQIRWWCFWEILIRSDQPQNIFLMCLIRFRAMKKKLQLVVEDIVQRNQVGFIQKRLLCENVLLASELVTDFHKEGETRRGSNSWIWKSLCNLRYMARPMIICEVGNGPGVTGLHVEAVVAEAFREVDDAYLWKPGNRAASSSFSTTHTWEALHPQGKPVFWHRQVCTKQKYSRDETKRQRTQEIAVDASLSTWLTTSPTSGCSSISMGAETAMSDSQRCRNTHQTTQKGFKATMKDLYREC
ncbi:BnaC09g51780D [Brassica napus]|uniref:BnaC09g51780D protein n=2 Tax=Brassica TaxID=3705 RepID=A0A078J649_BRANA|nr:BnaC09g51780D [Brassica napus]VDD30209.1 unnamed protein product [Brassica oleracea]